MYIRMIDRFKSANMIPFDSGLNALFYKGSTTISHFNKFLEIHILCAIVKFLSKVFVEFYGSDIWSLITYHVVFSRVYI